MQDSYHRHFQPSPKETAILGLEIRIDAGSGWAPDFARQGFAGVLGTWMVASRRHRIVIDFPRAPGASLDRA